MFFEKILLRLFFTKQETKEIINYMEDEGCKSINSLCVRDDPDALDIDLKKFTATETIIIENKGMEIFKSKNLNRYHFSFIKKDHRIVVLFIKNKKVNIHLVK